MEEYNALQSPYEECKKGLTKIYHTVTFSKLREKIFFYRHLINDNHSCFS